MRLKWLPEQGAVLDLVLTEQPDKASLFAVSYIANKRPFACGCGPIGSPNPP